MVQQGLTEDQWYSLTREERALRVGFRVASEAMEACRVHDEREKAKKK